MKLMNSKRLTVASLVFCGLSLYAAVQGDAPAAYAALILASLEMTDEV